MTKRFMKRMDANGDGKVSKEEFEAGPKKRFADNDLNNDGTISADERPAGRPGKGGWGWGFFGGGKKDGEGRGQGRAHEALTLAAVIERTDAKFKVLDTNGDGFIDANERTAAMEARIDLNVKRMMHRADANNDGQLSEAEFLARAEKRFATLDLNGDGKIGPEDLSPDQRRRWESEKK